MSTAEAQTTDPSDKRSRILAAAFEKFSAYGFSRTSMADIAEAAGMSRPALYLHFRNKEEIFRAALEALLNDAIDNALDALDPAAAVKPGSIANQLEEFLQRYHGDLMETFATTTHGDDFLLAKHTHAAGVVEQAAKRVRSGLTRYFGDLAGTGVFDPSVAGQPAARWVELLLLSPYGLKQDHPSVSLYRRRLRSLGASVASGMSGMPAL